MKSRKGPQQNPPGNLPQTFPEQEERLQRFFTAWKGEWPQLDDVTLIGMRLG